MAHRIHRHDGARAEVESIFERSTVGAAHMHGTAAYELGQRGRAYRLIKHSEAVAVRLVASSTVQLGRHLLRLRFGVHQSRIDLDSRLHPELVGIAQGVAMRGRRRVNLNAGHQNRHLGEVDVADEPGSSIGSLRFHQSGEARRGAPYRGVVVGDPVDLKERGQRRRHDHDSHHRLDQNEASRSSSHGSSDHFSSSATRRSRTA